MDFVIYIQCPLHDSLRELALAGLPVFPRQEADADSFFAHMTKKGRSDRPKKLFAMLETIPTSMAGAFTIWSWETEQIARKTL